MKPTLEERVRAAQLAAYWVGRKGRQSVLTPIAGEDAHPLRVASWNVQNKEGSEIGLAEFFACLDASYSEYDVVLIQELGFVESKRWERMSRHQNWVGELGLECKAAWEGGVGAKVNTAVFIKAAAAPFVKQWHKGGAGRVLGAKLQMGKSEWWIVSVYNSAHREERQRRAVWKELKDLQKSAPVVAGGDWNLPWEGKKQRK